MSHALPRPRFLRLMNRRMPVIMISLQPNLIAHAPPRPNKPVLDKKTFKIETANVEVNRVCLKHFFGHLVSYTTLCPIQHSGCKTQTSRNASRISCLKTKLQWRQQILRWVGRPGLHFWKPAAKSPTARALAPLQFSNSTYLHASCPKMQFPCPWLAPTHKLSSQCPGFAPEHTLLKGWALILLHTINPDTFWILQHGASDGILPSLAFSQAAWIPTCWSHFLSFQFFCFVLLHFLYMTNFHQGWSQQFKLNNGASALPRPFLANFQPFLYYPLPRNDVMNTAELRGWFCKVQQKILRTLGCLLFSLPAFFQDDWLRRHACKSHEMRLFSRGPRLEKHKIILELAPHSFIQCKYLPPKWNVFFEKGFILIKI